MLFKSSSASDNNTILTKLENLRKNHDTLCSLASLLNKVYSVPTLLETLHHFIVIIVTCLLHMEGSKPLKPDHSKLLYNMYDCLSLLSHSFEVIILTKICSKTTYEVS